MKKALAFLLSLMMILSLFGLTTFAYLHTTNNKLSVRMADDRYESGEQFTPEDFPDVEIIAIEEDDVPGFFLFTLSEKETQNYNDIENAVKRLQEYREFVDYVEIDQVRTSVTIDDDFEEGEILVVIKKAYSEVNKPFTPEDFPEIECTEVEDLMSFDCDPDDLGYLNQAGFHQILKIKLAKPGKPAVLDAIQKLYENPMIRSAEPNARLEISDEPGNNCEHEWQDATCIAPKTCTLCGATEGDVDPNAHQEAVTDAIVCYDRNCSECGALLATGFPADKTAHHYNQDGKCSGCGKTECELFGHTPGAEATKTEAQTCTVCGAILKEATGKGNPDTAAGDLFGAMAMLSLATAAAVLLKKKRFHHK